LEAVGYELESLVVPVEGGRSEVPDGVTRQLIRCGRPFPVRESSDADLITLLPTGLKTGYQRKIERLIATELLERPCTMGDRWASTNGLLERIKQHTQLGPLLASGALSDEALRELCPTSPTSLPLILPAAPWSSIPQRRC